MILNRVNLKDDTLAQETFLLYQLHIKRIIVTDMTHRIIPTTCTLTLWDSGIDRKFEDIATRTGDQGWIGGFL